MRSSSKREKADVARHELIGLEVTVESPHAGWDGLSGTIVDETKHMLVVESASGSETRVPKIGQRFLFRVGSGGVANEGGSPREHGPQFVRIDGADIAFRPEDRTKKVRG